MQGEYNLCETCGFIRSVLCYDDVEEDEAESSLFSSPTTIGAAYSTLKRDVRALWIPTSPEEQPSHCRNEVPVIDCPSPLVFLRDYVQLNRPVIIRGLIDDWKALHSWNDLLDLKSRVDASSESTEDDFITVDVTPNGKGDCVVKDDDHNLIFVKPEERRMRFSEFIDTLSEDGHINDESPTTADDFSSWASENQKKKKEGVCYYSHQNDCFRSPTESVSSTLLSDISPNEVCSDSKLITLLHFPI
eukprot:TRINITY_DN4326_c0_g1_i2.p1 TRINITY_DN4326_c0_g1~~TRINITY_DN4326_c0_g1_i2.p1  ORF type:complete len:246 (-),score=37.04 TRINITY_DN4326_c0_g1_i2:601-1338(-)